MDLGIGIGAKARQARLDSAHQFSGNNLGVYSPKLKRRRGTHARVGLIGLEEREHRGGRNLNRSQPGNERGAQGLVG